MQENLELKICQLRQKRRQNMIDFAKNEQIAALKTELEKTLRNNQTL